MSRFNYDLLKDTMKIKFKMASYNIRDIEADV